MLPPPTSIAARCCTRVLRCRTSSSLPLVAIPSQRERRRSQRRWQSAAATSSESSPKISSIVDQISQLTLLETADLVSSLKTRLNIPDMPIGGFAAAAAPAAPAVVEEAETAAPVQVKTLFALTLQSFDAAAKPKIIKEIKNLLGLSLVESKKFVESAPKLMKEEVPKEDSDKIIETMKALGAVVTME